MLGLAIVIAALLVVVLVLLLRVPDPHHEFMLNWVQLLDLEHRTGRESREDKLSARIGRAS